MKKIILALFSALLLTACSSYHAQYEIEVDAGDLDRPQSPMYTDVLLPSVPVSEPACLSNGKTKIPAQLESLGGGIARVWWLQPAMQAGEKQTWTIFVGKKCGKSRYAWIDSTGYSTTLTYNDIPVVEYIYLAFDPDQAIMTQKPYHHIFAPDGSQRITKGPCGLHSHQRGLFFGYRDVTWSDQTANFWATEDGSHTQHQAFAGMMTGPIMGGHLMNIEWKTGVDGPIAAETRSLRAFKLKDGSTLIDFQTHMETFTDALELGGNRHHGGVQFRASQYAADHQETVSFTRPAELAEWPANTELDSTQYDLPWDAMHYEVDGNPYTVVYMSAPSNPGPADMGERLYGKIGEYIPWTLNPQTPLQLHYRLWILQGHNHSREKLQQMYDTMGEPIGIQTLK